MKVRDVIDRCEELLQVPSTKSDLVDVFNLVERELALDYLPLYTTHQCDASVVYYDDFEYEPVRIIDCNCKFKIYPTYIEAKESITEVEYAYLPNKKGLYDECAYDQEALNCLVAGVMTEYFNSQGFYDEAYWWRKKYKQEIQNLMTRR